MVKLQVSRCSLLEIVQSMSPQLLIRSMDMEHWTSNCPEPDSVLCKELR